MGNLAAYAISQYPDVEDVYRRLNALVAQPMRPVRRDKMAEYLGYFQNQCTRSKALTDEAKKLIPGGVQHNLAFNYPFPIAVEKAEGAYMWDVDGNRYIDFLQAGGPTVLGSNYAPVRDRVVELLQSCGPVTGLFHEYELKLAQLVHRHMPSIEMFRMLGSGTEGVMAAVRAARTFTKKNKVIKVGGAYHGWSDSMIYGLHIPGTGRLEAKGIPGGATANTQEFFPNALGALKRTLILNRLLGGTAAVIVEPLGPESGTRPVPFDFNQKVRELCDEFGALLIFDEVVTGFQDRHGRRAGLFWRQTRSNRFWQMFDRRLPDGGRRGRTGGCDDEFRRGDWRDRRKGLRRRHAFGQPHFLRGRLPRPAGNGTHSSASSGRPGRRPPDPRPAKDHRKIPPALCGLQPGLHLSSGDLRGDAA